MQQKVIDPFDFHRVLTLLRAEYIDDRPILVDEELGVERREPPVL